MVKAKKVIRIIDSDDEYVGKGKEEREEPKKGRVIIVDSDEESENKENEPKFENCWERGESSGILQDNRFDSSSEDEPDDYLDCSSDGEETQHEEEVFSDCSDGEEDIEFKGCKKDEKQKKQRKRGIVRIIESDDEEEPEQEKPKKLTKKQRKYQEKKKLYLKVMPEYNFEGKDMVAVINTFCKETGFVIVGAINKRYKTNTKLKGPCFFCGKEFSKQFRCLKTSGGPVCVGCTIARTNLKLYGETTSMMIPEFVEKHEATMTKNHGVNKPWKSEAIQEKKKATCRRKYGKDFYIQTEECKKRIIATNQAQWGKDYFSQTQEWQDKIKAGYQEKYGLDWFLQTQMFRDKTRETMIARYGVPYAMQCEECRELRRLNCRAKYGVDNHMQVAEIAEKQMRNAYKCKPHKFRSGRIDWVQGYEHFALDDLTEEFGVDEDDIVTSRLFVPDVRYHFGEDKKGNPKERRYYTDIYIISQNKCIEVKSRYTFEKEKERNLAKQAATKALGFECEIWIYDQKGRIIEIVY